MRLTLSLVVLLWLPSLASAEIYKCTQGGRTVYSGSPCGTDAVKVHAGEESAEEKQRLRDAAAGRQEAGEAMAEASRNARSRTSTTIVTPVSAPRQPSKREYCDRLLKTAKAAKDESNMYRYHQGLIDDAKRRQKEAEDEHFSNCYGSNF